MTVVNYNVRIDKELRDSAFAVLDHYGLSPSQAIKLFLKQVAGTGTVPLSFDYGAHTIAYEKNPITMQAIEEARQGNLTRYDSLDDLMADLEQDAHDSH